MSLTREDFLAFRPRTARVDLPGLGGAAHLRVIPIGELIAIGEAPAADQPLLPLIASICDEAGTPLFTRDDLPALRNLPAPDFQALSEAIARLNGLDESAKNG